MVQLGLRSLHLQSSFDVQSPLGTCTTRDKVIYLVLLRRSTNDGAAGAL